MSVLQAMKVKSAIPHPLIMGVIHECGGKMHMQVFKAHKLLYHSA